MVHHPRLSRGETFSFEYYTNSESEAGLLKAVATVLNDIADMSRAEVQEALAKPLADFLRDRQSQTRCLCDECVSKRTFEWVNGGDA
jgi:hypothetical protein